MSRWRDSIPIEPSWHGAVLGVLVFGSVWGLAEATLGGLLHAVHFGNTGGVMGGIGMATVGAHLSIFRRPRQLPFLGLVAAMFKPLDAIVVGAPVFSNFVMNPATAIVLESLAFGAVATVLLGTFRDRVQTRIATGVLSAFAGFAAYGLVATWAGWGRWPYWSMSMRLEQVWHDGAVIALVGTVLFLIVHAATSQTRLSLYLLSMRQPALIRFAGLTGAFCCWSIAAVVSATGVF